MVVELKKLKYILILLIIMKIYNVPSVIALDEMPG